MITFFVLSLLGLWVHEAVSGELPEKMDAIPVALPVWKEPIVVSVLASGSLQYMRSLVGPIRSIVRERRPRCFTMAVLNCYNALLDRGIDQPLALMMAHENCDPDVCPYCTRPKDAPVTWPDFSAPIPVSKGPRNCLRRFEVDTGSGRDYVVVVGGL